MARPSPKRYVTQRQSDVSNGLPCALDMYCHYFAASSFAAFNVLVTLLALASIAFIISS